MGRVYTVCVHPARNAIDQTLKTDGPLRDIAVEFGVSKAALHRHWRAHTSAEIPPESAADGMVPKTAGTNRRAAILKWVIAGGIGVLAGWRIRAAFRG
jgi:hypothetical protein